MTVVTTCTVPTPLGLLLRSKSSQAYFCPHPLHLDVRRTDVREWRTCADYNKPYKVPLGANGATIDLQKIHDDSLRNQVGTTENPEPSQVPTRSLRNSN